MGSIEDKPTTDVQQQEDAKPTFDPAALKAKYRAERDKRLTEKGTFQYREIEEGVLKHYADDPYSTPLSREPVDEEVEFLIVGGGFGGQLMSVRLLEAGITDLRIVEKAGDFGGTWYWNRYVNWREKEDGWSRGFWSRCYRCIEGAVTVKYIELTSIPQLPGRRM